LTGPVSFRLAGAGWTRRSPRPALVLWQAVCLTAGFSVVAGLVLLAVEPLGNTLIGAAWNWFAAMLTGSLQVPVWRLVCGLAAASISLGLLAVVARTAVLTVRRRHAHRQVLDLLTQPPARSGRSRLAATSEVRILDARAAVAYTLPGWHSRVVLSAGLVDLLTEPELTAVVEHEQAHLRARHDLLVLPFQAWAVALGWIPGVRPAGSSVAELTEMLADDVAAGRTSRSSLASALAKVALSGTSADAPASDISASDITASDIAAADIAAGENIAAAGPGTRRDSPTIIGPAIAGTAVADRVRRLLDPRPLSGPQTALVYLASLLLLLIPASVLLLHWA
jgi:Zn-dependent protease with chaperone function